MNSTFYLELMQVADTALAALDRYESGEDKTSLFSDIRSVGAACLDGDKLDTSIRNDLGPRRILVFNNAVFYLVRLNTLTRGRSKNPAVSNALHIIKRLAGELNAELEVREQAVSVNNERNTLGASHQPVYVDAIRIAELRALPNAKLDAKRLIRLLEELNEVHAAGCHMATAMLVRAIADHVPPVFEVRTFGEVASNYSGVKSFKASMQNLQNSLRNIADAHLHVQMRGSEVLPTERQVDFRTDLDVLLGEIVRVMKVSP